MYQILAKSNNLQLSYFRVVSNQTIVFRGK